MKAAETDNTAAAATATVTIKRTGGWVFAGLVCGIKEGVSSWSWIITIVAMDSTISEPGDHSQAPL